VTHVLCWTHSQVLYAAERFLSVMNAQATEIYDVLVEGGFPFYAVAVVSYNAFVDMGGCDIRLPGWTIFSMNP